MTKRTSPHPTAHDVARLAGVSQAAVSRAFTTKASIALATRNKVFEAANALGYRPNLLARSLIKGKSGMVGVVISPLSPFCMAVLDAFSARLSDVGKHMLVFTNDGAKAVDKPVEALMKFRVDAIVLIGVRVTAKQARQCHEAQVPIIAFSRSPRNMKGVASITSDNVAGSEVIARHLIAQGYRTFGYMAGPEESKASQEREAGFTAHLTSLGLPAPERAVGQFHRAGAFEAARSLLSRTPRPEAIFCATDEMALALIEVARHELNLAIGREVGVAGFDGIEEAAWPTFDLTTYSTPVESVIGHLSPMLLDEQPELPLHTVITGKLEARGSTRRD
jgi:DNA-binding LacI/PurR family transcriptional regulator